MGKAQPTPPPQQSLAIAAPPPPVPGLGIEFAGDRKSSDPDIQRVLEAIGKRQAATQKEIDEMTPGGMAFGMMRHLPRDKWNTPLTQLGHWPRGTSIAEIKKNPKLMDLTPGQAIIKLFEMDDEMKKGKK